MLSKRHFTALSNFRHKLAGFLRFSERAAREAGITPRQYLLLLHVRGTIGRDWASVGELAIRLQASPHGTAALVARGVAQRLVTKRRSSEDARRVQVRPTPRGRRLVAQIAARHRAELQSLRDVMVVADVE